MELNTEKSKVVVNTRSESQEANECGTTRGSELIQVIGCNHPLRGALTKTSDLGLDNSRHDKSAGQPTTTCSI